jgi:DNA (cytosine-5)-methyltransferase 1
MQTFIDFSDNPVMPRLVGGVNQFNVPEVLTKDIKMSFGPEGRRRVRLSSNFLPLVGFRPGIRTSMVALKDEKGFEIKFDPKGSTKVYSRSYSRRKNNPIEAQLDIQNQSFLNGVIPSYAERLHFTLQLGAIKVRPLPNRTWNIRESIKNSTNPYEAFVAMSSGIDMHCLEKTGFNIKALLEYRPQEARDKQMLTETGVINALINGSPKYVFNEDISTVSWDRLKNAMDADPVSLLHLSLQCDDFSNAKSRGLKSKSIQNLDTSADLVYDGLRLVETVQPAVVIVENVPGFKSSGAGELLKVKLRKWGYFVHEEVMDARQHGGLTSRKRYYLVASIWPGFSFPSATNHTKKVWDEIEPLLEECRDVTSTKTVHEGIRQGRARLIRKDVDYAPTVMKSQNRQAKDSIYIEHEGRYLFPTENVLKVLNGFPDDINLNGVSSTIASEIIGQSIDYPMHESIVRQVKNHIAANHNGIVMAIGNQESV